MAKSHNIMAKWNNGSGRKAINNSGIKIIKALIENKEKELNISRISEISKIDYKTTYIMLNNLEKEGLIIVKPFGRSKKIMLNVKNHPLIFSAEFERREEMLENKDFRLIENDLESIDAQFIALMFGSHVKGNATKHSDIDILLICDEQTAKKIESKLNLLALKIHITNVSSEDFIRMARSKQFNVVNEAIKNNVVLIGIEDYYRLLKNAGQ